MIVRYVVDQEEYLCIFIYSKSLTVPAYMIRRNDTLKFIYTVVSRWNINDYVGVSMKSIYDGQVDAVPLNSIFTYIARTYAVN